MHDPINCAAQVQAQPGSIETRRILHTVTTKTVASPNLLVSVLRFGTSLFLSFTTFLLFPLVPLFSTSSEDDAFSTHFEVGRKWEWRISERTDFVKGNIVQEGMER